MTGCLSDHGTWLFRLLFLSYHEWSKEQLPLLILLSHYAWDKQIW